jgi:hypothetical protein
MPRNPMPGALAVGSTLRGLISDLLKASTLSRFEVASRMSDLTGQEITKHQLDAWTAESREAWRFPLEYLPALEVALETHVLTAWLAGLRGCKVLVGKEALDAEIGKLDRLREDAAKRIRQLKAAMGDME